MGGEDEQPTEAGAEGALLEAERAAIGDRCGVRPGDVGEHGGGAPWQPGQAGFADHRGDGGEACRTALRGESVGDAVDRHLHAAQLQDASVAALTRLPGAGGGLLRRLPRTLEELPPRVGAIGGAEVAEAAQAVAERLRRGPAVHAADVSGAQRLVASVVGILRLEEGLAEPHNPYSCILHTTPIYHVCYPPSTAACGDGHKGEGPGRCFAQNPVDAKA